MQKKKKKPQWWAESYRDSAEPLLHPVTLGVCSAWSWDRHRRRAMVSALWAFLSVTVVYSCVQSQHRRARAAQPQPEAGRNSEQNDLLAQPDPR